MDATAVVAIVSVIVTGGVTPYVAARVAAGRFEAEKRRDREDELRDVLDNAGVKLTETLFSLGTVRENISQVTRAALKPYEADLLQLWKNDDRLSVRLGSQAPEVELFRKAINALTNVRTVIEKGLDEGFDNAIFKAIDEGHSDALDAQNQFYDAASRRIGPGEVKRETSPRWRDRLPGGGRKQDPPQLNA